jgi:hypothetical protein
VPDLVALAWPGAYEISSDSSQAYARLFAASVLPAYVGQMLLQHSLCSAAVMQILQQIPLLIRCGRPERSQASQCEEAVGAALAVCGMGVAGCSMLRSMQWLDDMISVIWSFK